MVVRESSKLHTRVRFPSPAPCGIGVYRYIRDFQSRVVGALPTYRTNFASVVITAAHVFGKDEERVRLPPLAPIYWPVKGGKCGVC